MSQAEYPKRLIEVDLPIKKISEHARREKSIRHGHISTLHIWWARRPLAACRAVICAALWPDPADPLCPVRFKDDAIQIMARFCNPLGRPDLDYSEPLVLRKALLDFIADFSNWDNSTDQRYLETARALTQSAHESLGGAPGSRPLVVDPFAGGGSIPLEALRVGADAFASDLNPVAVLLNKVVLEYIPKYGQQLADEVRKWGEWIKIEAEKELLQFYPKDPDGATPIAYLWARTITCEGPGCGAEIPLIRSLWLGKKPHNSWSMKLIPNNKFHKIDLEIVRGAKPSEVGNGTIKKGSVSCPLCGYTTPVDSVRSQLKAKKGGATTAKLLCVALIKPNQQGRFYRLPTESDLAAIKKAEEILNEKLKKQNGMLDLLPEEPLPPQGTLGFRVQLYGIAKWKDLFSSRQLLALITFIEKLKLAKELFGANYQNGLGKAIQDVVALNIDKMADYGSSLSSWLPQASQETVAHTFARQALPMVWDFAEAYPFAESSGGWIHGLEFLISPLRAEQSTLKIEGTVENTTATNHPLPDDSGDAFITDPPYYDAIPYADLSDFFLVWLKRSTGLSFQQGNKLALSPKEDECVVDDIKGHDRAFFENTMTKSLEEGRRILRPYGISVVVFAHKSTTGWEAQIKALIDAGWIVTGSWPIDTERSNRLRAFASAALASSIHLVCRPREHPSGEVRTDDIGDWREVLSELPQRIHAWLPGLAAEGVVGADAIFSCLGPALEIYSRYSRVEKVNGEVVTLKEYLEEVWAAVSREALSTIFSGDTAGFEEDARITAMWLWTLSAGANGATVGQEEEESEDEGPAKAKVSGFVLEYDAARKIAQGLGVSLENIPSIVEVKKDKARLLPVSERASYLLGRETIAPRRQKKEKMRQMTLLGEVVEGTIDSKAPGTDFSAGKTMLDRLHQAMLLFAAGLGESLGAFLREQGQDQSLWSLAQALAALYPAGSEERRWVEGVLARKKSLGI